MNSLFQSNAIFPRGFQLFAVIVAFLFAFVPLSHAREKFLDIQELTTQSGLTFWLVEDHSIPVIALNFAFENAGSKYDALEKQGLTRLASNTMDEGAGDILSEEFQGLLRTQSISLGFSAGRDTFGGSIYSRTSTMDKAAALMKEALTQPRFDEAPLQRMKDSNLARIRSSQSDPQWIAARFANDIMFEGHPYALNSGGTLSTLPAITPDDLRKFVQTRLAKDVLEIAIVGDVTPEQAKTYVENIFGSLPPVQTMSQQARDFTLQNLGQAYVYDLDIPQSIVMGFLPALSRTDPDYYAFQVMNQILGAGGFGSRLTEEVREKRGLTYGIGTYLTQMEHIDYLTLSSSTANENAGEMIALAKAEMQKMADTLVSEDERKKAIDYINGSLPLTLSSTSNISSLLMGMQSDDLPIDYLDKRAAGFNAVTVEDIQRVAKKYLKPDEMGLIIIGKPENIEIENVTNLSTLPNVE